MNSGSCATIGGGAAWAMVGETGPVAASQKKARDAAASQDMSEFLVGGTRQASGLLLTATW